MKKDIRIYQKKLKQVKKEIHKGFLGQEEVVDTVIKAILCNSHALLEGLPGMGKTLLVRIISLVTGLNFKRIQFTPDLLPSDIIGTEIYVERTRTFKIQKGPIFANLVLADEINRSPPKVQSALLQAMEEREVTIGNETLKLPSPFFVLATQNPIEQEGTFPLSIAQNDRFIFKIYVDYPSQEAEFKMIERNVERLKLKELKIKKVITGKEILEIHEAIKSVEISEDIRDYIMDIIEATRHPEEFGLKELSEYIKFGVSPRATIFIPLAARATALMNGRDYVVFDDVKEVIPLILRHRLTLSYKAEAERVKPMDIIKRILEGIPAV